MQISLPPKLEELVRKKVESGRYSSPSDVITDALRRMAAQEEAESRGLRALRAAVAVGAEQADRGEFVPDNWLAELEAQLDKEAERDPNG